MADIVPYNHFPAILRCDEESHMTDETLEFVEDVLGLSDATEAFLGIFGSYDLSLFSLIIIVQNGLLAKIIYVLISFKMSVRHIRRVPYKFEISEYNITPCFIIW